MAQQHPLILALVVTKGISYPRLPLCHFGVNTQVPPFNGVAVVLGPHRLMVKNPHAWPKEN